MRELDRHFWNLEQILPSQAINLLCAIEPFAEVRLKNENDPPPDFDSPWWDNIDWVANLATDEGECLGVAAASDPSHLSSDLKALGEPSISMTKHAKIFWTPV